MLVLLGVGLVACAPEAPATTASQASAVPPTSSPVTAEGKLSVVATTSVMGEFVRAVGGERVTVQELVPAGGDAHTFAPSPESIRTLARSAVLFANGAGLEGWLEQATAAAPEVRVVRLADALPLHSAGEDGHHHEEHGAEQTQASGPSAAAPADEHADHDHAAHEHGDLDPHAWWDADLVSGYLDGIAAALSELDPAGAAVYRQNAQAYAAQVREVDAYGQAQFAAIPTGQRRVVTSHDSLNYFAERYGIEAVGAVIPGLSTEREPSAQELAALAAQMREQNVRVILTENVVSDRLAQALATETGAVVAPPVYTDALGPAGSPGATYLGAFRHNIDTVAAALRGVE
ncbi:metal ABC transporter solute-binding protein, Zn/Mn family [Deinococcus piscis]|nr:zinc ABC transporter substrate-binding protein [Deinococcus piscis]